MRYKHKYKHALFLNYSTSNTAEKLVNAPTQSSSFNNCFHSNSQCHLLRTTAQICCYRHCGVTEDEEFFVSNPTNSE